MISRIRPLSLALVLLALPAAAQQKAVISTSPSANWNGKAVQAPDGAGLAYCTTENTYDNGLKLAFARNPKGEVNIAVGFPDGRLQPSVKYPLTVDVDGQNKRTVEGFAPDPKVLVMQMKSDPTLYGLLGSGSRLNIEGPTDIISFALKGTSKALADLKLCSESPDGGGVADAATLPPQFPPALVAILRGADLGQVTLLNIPRQENAPIDYAWKIGEVLGGVKEAVPAPGTSFQQMVDSYMGGLEQRCTGAFTKSLGQPEPIQQITLQTAEVTCQLPEKPTAVSLLFYTTGAVFAVFFHETTPDRAAEAQSARDKIAGTFRRFIADGTMTVPAPGAAQR